MATSEKELEKVGFEELVVGNVKVMERDDEEIEQDQEYKVMNGKKKRYEFVYEQFDSNNSNERQK